MYEKCDSKKSIEAKFQDDLEQVLKLGIQVNLDNDHEMELVDELLKNSCQGTTAKVGLRINPVVGAG